ncbi:hypothetical protein Tco_0917915 [Tanacetum coccineum]
MVEGSENVIDDSLLPRNDKPYIPDTRLEPRSDKESLKVESTNDEEVEVTNVVIPVNVNEEEDEITDEVYELKRREKGKIVEETRSTLFPTPIRSPMTHTNLGRYTYSFGHLKKRFLSRKSFDMLADHLQEVMVESLPTMVDTHIKEQVKRQVPEQVRDQVPVYVAEGLIMERQKTKEEMERMIAKAILQEHGNIQAEISLQIQKAIDHHIPSQVDASVRSYMSGHILHVHPAQSQTLPVPEQQYQLYLSMKNDPQLQQQDIAIWLALQMKFQNLQVPQTTCRPSAICLRDQDDPHDDAYLEGENSAKRQKTSEYEAYVSRESSSHHDDEIPSKQVSQDIMEEVSLTIDEAKLKKMADEMLRDPEAPALSLINQDLLYLKKGSSGPEKIVLSLHKFPAIIFNDDDIEERTSRWPDYKNLNKNDIKDMYLLIMNGKVPDYAETGLLWSLSVFIRSLVIWERVHDFQLGIESYQQKVNLTAPTISFPGVEKHKMFSIIYEPVHGNSYYKDEDYIMRLKDRYVQRELTNDEVEYLKLFEEEIEVRLKYRNQMSRWEMFVNGRPLGPRRERPE